MAARLARLLPGLWSGLLLAVAMMAAPAAFAVLPSADAGRVVGRLFAQEAWVSLALTGLLLWLLRAQGHAPLLWAAAACTLLGYFALQPLMAAARAGSGSFSFGQLHLASTMLYGLKTLLVLCVAWRVTLNRAPPSS